MKSYIVIGLGRFGGSLARQLCTLGAEVLAMDVHNDLVQQLANDVTHAVVGDARDKEVLRALGVRNFDCAVIAIGDDLAASVLITMNLKELGAPYLVAKANDDLHAKVLERVGADRVVLPESEGTRPAAGKKHVFPQCAGLHRAFPGLRNSGSSRPQELDRQVHQ